MPVTEFLEWRAYLGIMSEKASHPPRQGRRR
jgi:hypothetical protein